MNSIQPIKRVATRSESSENTVSCGSREGVDVNSIDVFARGEPWLVIDFLTNGDDKIVPEDFEQISISTASKLSIMSARSDAPTSPVMTQKYSPIPNRSPSLRPSHSNTDATSDPAHSRTIKAELQQTRFHNYIESTVHWQFDGSNET